MCLRKFAHSRVALLVSIFLFCSLASAFSDDLPRRALRKGDRIALAGDSITEQKLYSLYVETYLLACAPELKLKVMLNGWAGETTSGFLWRMPDLLVWKPDVLTVCYGMNDGLYLPYAASTGDAYRRNLGQIIENMDQADGLTLIASPGVVDTASFKIPSVSAASYNCTLAELAKIACQVADEHRLPYAEIHTPMLNAMTEAKKLYSPQFLVAGKDGIHPGPNGQLLMAWCMLKAMGFNGTIGTITLDWKGEATASEGHRILEHHGGRLQMESRRWPFCLYGQKEDPESMIGMLRFIPFQEELNRFNLVVRNLPTAKANVYFGEYCKTFTREDLESGVNLANEFLTNPFSPVFADLNSVVFEKQSYEGIMVKTGTAGLRFLKEKALPEDKSYDRADKAIRKKLMKKQADYMEKATETVKPLRYTIEVVPVGE